MLEPEERIILISLLKSCDAAGMSDRSQQQQQIPQSKHNQIEGLQIVLFYQSYQAIR